MIKNKPSLRQAAAEFDIPKFETDIGYPLSKFTIIDQRHATCDATPASAYPKA